MSTIDFTQLPTDAYGKTAKFEDGELTLGRMCVMALDAALPDDKADSERFKRGMLAHEIAQAEMAKKPIELPAESIALLKERIVKLFTAGSIVRSAWLMLDPASIV